MTNDPIEQISDEVKQKIAHFNIPQQQNWIVNAHTTIAIMGRAGGKDHGFVAPIALRNARGMPRGASAFISPTYLKAKSDTVPSMVKALEKYNFYENIDFWVGKNIPETIKHAKAYEHPRGDAVQNSIFFRNGHIIRTIGLDRKDSANGQSNDFIFLNEARFIKEEDFDSRVKPTNRGNEDIPALNSLHYHHGLLITSDMPRTSSAKWILKYEKLMDQDQIDLIVNYDFAQHELIKSIGDELLTIDPKLSLRIKQDKEKLLEVMEKLVLKGKLTDALDKRFRKELRLLDNRLFELRRSAVFSLRASTLDNIDAIGERFIDDMYRSLGEKEFRTSILNEEIDGADDPFYSTFDDEVHCYDDINYDYVDLWPDPNHLPQPWRKDGDVDPNRKLEIALDWNKEITCMEVGQEFPHVFKYLNSLQVFDPERIKHLAKAFDDYYKGFPTKRVTHHYDHTAVGEDASRERSYADELAAELRALGWTVDEHYIGQASTHRSRNKLFLRVYAGDDINTKPVRINRTNCKDNLVPSLQNAGSYQNLKGIQKDKRKEGSKTIRPEHNTHHTDAHDTLYIGVFQSRLGDNDYEPDFLT